MAWVAFDRALRSVDLMQNDAARPPDATLAHWRALRDEIHEEVCERGFDPELNSFVQSYGSKALDASLLLIAHMASCPRTTRGWSAPSRR